MHRSKSRSEAKRPLVEPPQLVQVSPTQVEYQGQLLRYFGGSDYFRFSWHPRIRRAVSQSLRELGLSVASSRMVTGNHPIYLRLESELAKFFRFPSAVLVSGGYSGPLVAAQALEGLVTHVLVDARAHGCLKDAAALLGMRPMSFQHDDPDALGAAIRRCGRQSRVAVFTDGLSAHEGTIAPLREYLEHLPENGLLLVDDAHGTGTLGRRGNGSLEHLRLRDSRIILATTLSKALGCYGGAVLGPRWLRERVLRQSRIYGSSTALPLPLAAASIVALEMIHQDGAALRARLCENARIVKEAFRDSHPDWLNRPGPMFAVAPATVAAQESLRRMLLGAGIYPALIRYASGPADRFFRFAISTAHTRAPLAALRDLLLKFQQAG
ncbi:MAG: pyridoxal phosphate-dependent aminotransferase family protein, partial [Acidobacteria bacterium]|nr:pyridoxal phosphate-dependent aminotransferase family protein [Acidobacteriota bacterium]